MLFVPKIVPYSGCLPFDGFGGGANSIFTVLGWPSLS